MRNIVFMLFIVAPFSVQAQISIGPAVDFGLTSMHNKNVENDPAWDMRGNWYLYFGGNADYFFNDHIGVGIGALLTGYGSTTTLQSFTYQGDLIPASGTNEINTTYGSIPLMLKIRTNTPGNMGFYVNPFIQANFAFAYEQSYSYNIDGFSISDKQTGSNNLAPAMFTGGAEFGIEVPVSSNARVTAGPRIELFSTDTNLKEDRNPYTESSGQVMDYQPWQAHSIMLALTAYFTLGKKD